MPCVTILYNDKNHVERFVVKINEKSVDFPIESHDFEPDCIMHDLFFYEVKKLVVSHFQPPPVLEMAELSHFEKIVGDFMDLSFDIQEIGTDAAALLSSENPETIPDSINQFLQKLSDRSRDLDQKAESLTRDIEKSELTPETITQLRHYLQRQINGIKTKSARCAQEIASYKNRITYLENANDLTGARRLEAVIKMLVPVQDKQKAESFFLNNETGFYHYKLDHPEIEGIRRISLYGESLLLFPNDLIDADEAILQVSFSNGDKKLLELPKGTMALCDLNELVHTSHAHLDLTCSQVMEPFLGKTFFDDKLAGYDEEIVDHYQLLHQEIRDEIAAFVKHLPQPIKLIFLGCGTGNEIKPVIRWLEENHIRYQIFGIDLYMNNIHCARNQPEFEKRPVTFICGDAANLDTLLEIHLAKSRQTQPSSTICIASGFLTRMTIKDSVEAFEIFKKAAHYADRIIITGRTSNLIARRDAKAAGMHNTQRNLSADSQLVIIDHYTAIDINSQALAIMNQLKLQKHRKRIHLKDHARAIRVLRQIFDNGLTPGKHTIEIDLRDAYIKSTATKHHASELNKLIQFMNQFKLRIIVTGNESWYQSLQKAVVDTQSRISIRPVDHVSLINNDNIRIFERRKISEKMEERVRCVIAPK